MARGRPSRSAIHQRLSAEVQELRERFGGLPSPEDASEIWAGIWQFEAHNSTALEGNTLVLREVAVLLEEGRAVGNKDLKDYLEVRGYADAAEWVYRQGRRPPGWSSAEPLTVAEVRHVHR